MDDPDATRNEALRSRYALLRRASLFSGMTDRSLEAVAGMVREVEFEPGAELVREGEAGDSFLVLVEGAADVTTAAAGPLDGLRAGDFLGEIALIDGKPRSATVTARTPIRALLLERAEFERLLETYPAIRLEVLMAFTGRLRREAARPID